MGDRVELTPVKRTPETATDPAPVLSPDEIAEVKRIYREGVRLVHLWESSKARAEVLADNLDDKYSYRENGFYLDFETARFIRREPPRQMVPVHAGPPGGEG